MDAINLLPGIALPGAFGPPAQALQPGQVINALVLELLESGAFRLQLPQAVVDVRANVALIPGSTVTLAVKGTAANGNARLVIYSDPAAPAAAAVSGQGDVPSLAGRHPIGEAVIIARAAPGPHARTPVETAAARDTPRIAARILVPQPDAPTARDVSPERAVGDAVRVAAARQTGLAPLFADVEQVVQAASGTLPTPVRAAAKDLLALRVPLDEQLTAADVKQAFVRSGVLFEPRLAAARQVFADTQRVAPDAPRAAPDMLPAKPDTLLAKPDTPRAQAGAPPVATDDLKAALLVFRQVLKVWASEPGPVRTATPPAPSSAMAPEAAPARSASLPIADAASIKHVNALAGGPGEQLPNGTPLSPEQATSLAKSVGTALHTRETMPAQPAASAPGGPPPPYRGAPLAAQPPAQASIAPDAVPREAAERLITQTDGALARQTLLQVASLPDQPSGAAQRIDTGAQRWNFEVPFATPQGTGIAQFEVSRDGRTARSDAQTPVWRARFSLDIEPMGPVHAQIALAGERASVTLWAERPATATRLNEHAPLLSEALRAAELSPGDLQLRLGAPPSVAKQAAPGKFMDRAS